MTQLIADVMRQDEERRLLREVARTLVPPYYDDYDVADEMRRVYDAAVDAQAGQMAAMRGNPFAVWMGSTPPGLDIAEFTMPPQWDRGEYSAPTARYRAQ